jgi:hypothetical protein
MTIARALPAGSTATVTKEMAKTRAIHLPQTCRSRECRTSSCIAHAAGHPGRYAIKKCGCGDP